MRESLYDRDALLWSEQQADLLRRLAAGERVNDAVDWPNVIEELEAMGRSELRACEGLLLQGMLHLLKLHAWPESWAAAHWRGEVDLALFDAGRAFTPFMRQRIGLDTLYVAAAWRLARMTDDSGAGRAAPKDCPYTLEDLLVDLPDIDALVTRLGAR